MRFGLVFFRAALLADLLFAWEAGRQAGYPFRLSPLPERPQGLPVFTSRQSSLNHFFKAAPFLDFRTAMLLLLALIAPVLRTNFSALSNST